MLQPYSEDNEKKNLINLHFHEGAYVLGGCRPMNGG